MEPLLRDRGVRSFLLVWAGQVVSLLGSGLMAFALGVWIYQSTASTTQYALVTFCAAVPPLVVLPLAGPLIDRLDRRRLLIGSDLAAAAATGATCLLAWTGGLSLAPACLIVAVTAGAAALQWPTWGATVTLLVPRAHLGRASGMTQIAQAIAQVVSPLLAGGLLAAVGLAGIAAIDLATFGVSIVALVAARLPAGPRGTVQRLPYGRDLLAGWTWIFSRAGLAALLLMFGAVNFFSELASILFTPLVLGFASAAVLGSILSAGGAGLIAGGALMSVWGGPRRAALGAAAFAAASGAVIAAAGCTLSPVLLGAAAFGFFFCLPLMAGSSQLVWQRSVPAGLQGRVFAARAAVAMSAGPLAALAAGPLADRVFEPAMSGTGALAAAFGPLVGVGPGRGIALILVGAGALTVLAAAAAALYGPLRRLDREEAEDTAAAPACAEG